MDDKELFDFNSDDPVEKERAICLLKNCDVRKIFLELKECKKRVESKSYTTETCHQEMCDLMETIDHCVGAKAFNKLQ